MNTKKYTFQNLFGNSFNFDNNEIILNKIEIPIIQRDYAQGRNNKKVERIRERFLDALFNAIVNKKEITLDFVYGDISSNGVLTPLDGQQRLTTLFLLHWYIAKKENIEKENYNFLKNFSYAVRFSSRDFCRELVDYSPDFSNRYLSIEIKDQPWYPYEWKNDPTIQSMLVMIDTIHHKFYDFSNLWDSLVEKKLINFYFLPLNQMGLTDDLYIKMNSRGKPLTTFEHFKAEFEEIVHNVSEELSKEINHKFDIEWTDMLFPYRGDNNIVDDEFMRYFHFISDIISYKEGINIEKDEFKLAKKVYSKENPDAEKHIKYLINSFDCWYSLNIDEFFKNYFTDDIYEHNKVKIYQRDLNIFKEACDNYGIITGKIRKFPLNKFLLLYSINTYLQNKDKITEEQFIRRIRIIRNLIWNSQDEIREDRMKNLLSETKSIITNGIIPDSEKGDLGYNVNQKNEEINKIKWLLTNENKKEELFELEDHALLKGNISILGLENNSNFNKFSLLFNNCDKDKINRALLSIGDYSQKIRWRYQIGAQRIESVWFDLFHPTKKREGFGNTKKILNLLLSGLDENKINNESLDKMVDDYLSNENTLKDWRYYILKYDDMRKGNYGMYFWDDKENKSYEIIMMNTEKSIGGHNWNIFLYTLYHSPEFSGKLSLGNYYRQGDKLVINDSGIELDCLNDRYEVSIEEETKEFLIKQENGIDIEDRIEIGKNLLRNLINNKTGTQHSV